MSDKKIKRTSQNKYKISEKNMEKIHFPVLPEAVLDLLQPQKGDTYLDLTAGYGGHAKAILERTFNQSGATLVDRDQQAIAFLQNQTETGKCQIIHKDFLAASRELLKAKKQFNIILADLGVSSPHLDLASRGFSIRLDGPLDMRMDQSQSLTAETIINTYKQERLMNLFREYGEEPHAAKIARLIVENRPLFSTRELAQVIAKAWPGRSKKHPATRVFQALRLAVNREIEQLSQALPIWIELLAPGGRIAVISFHSLEDRIVKRYFQENAGNHYDARLTLLTKSPVMADVNEIVSNPRARSAKLRAAAKIKNPTERGVAHADSG